jgi:hypothetical protein
VVRFLSVEQRCHCPAPVFANQSGSFASAINLAGTGSVQLSDSITGQLLRISSCHYRTDPQGRGQRGLPHGRLAHQALSSLWEIRNFIEPVVISFLPGFSSSSLPTEGLNVAFPTHAIRILKGPFVSALATLANESFILREPFPLCTEN